MKRFVRGMAVLLLLCMLPLAASARQRVYDDAQVFTPAEEQEITAAADAFAAQTGMDYAVVTINEALGTQTHYDIARSYYLLLALGTGDNDDGALYYLNFYPDNRSEYLYTNGAMIDYMTDARIEQALDKSNPLLRDGRYADGALAMVAAVQGFIKQGIPEGSYRYDSETGERLTSYYKVITPAEAAVGAAICLLIGLAFVLIIRSRYKLKGSTYYYDYQANAKLTLTEDADQYLRTTVTRTRRVQNQSGGGGGMGGGGGSGVHSGGGGGGGRSF